MEAVERVVGYIGKVQGGTMLIAELKGHSRSLQKRDDKEPRG